jgi:integrase
MNAPNHWQSRVESYLAYRRQAGYALLIEGRQLMRFADFAEQVSHHGPLTLKLAVAWARASPGQKQITAARRIEVLRPFARYWQQFDPATEIPPGRLFGRAHRRLRPHIYTRTELRELLDATDHLHPTGGLRGACCRALFGLLASAGLRLSEATGLERGDVDLEQGLLQIRGAKFGKSRWVPLHSTTTRELKQYAQRRDNHPLTTRTQAFFVGDYGRPAQPRNLEYAFEQLRERLRWRSRGQYPAPRIHDLRHTFICHTLELWYDGAIDIDANMLALSTYVGHAKLTDTYWYVTATPELMAAAARRFEDFPGSEPS